MKVLSGPPGPVIFTWRHWAQFTGTFRGRQGNGELIELYGLCRVIVNDDVKIQKIEVSCQHYIITRKSVESCRKYTCLVLSFLVLSCRIYII